MVASPLHSHRRHSRVSVGGGHYGAMVWEGAACTSVKVCVPGMQAIAPYKNKLPSSDDETEYVENLFNALCATLMTPKNRQVFVDAEGVELMVLILKQKKAVRASALKALVGLSN